MKSLSSLMNAQPRPVRLDAELVRVSHLNGEGTYPLLLQPHQDQIILADWARGNSAFLASALLRHGAVLLRGFNINSVASFRGFIRAFTDCQIRYTDQSSPRTLIEDGIYTSTEHPADQLINMHNELSYSHNWPMHLIFFCAQPADDGGETPIADSRRVLNLLSSATRRKFTEKGVMYMRNLTAGIGLSWQQVYETNSRTEVEEYCRKNGIIYEWKEQERLVIRWTRPAVQDHPRTGEKVWFNHAYFFNAQTLDPSVRAVIGREAELPFNTYYGDGSPIEPQVIEELRRAYRQATSLFAWEKGDILLLDNMLMSHGRNPFRGSRNIAVAMSDPHH